MFSLSNLGAPLPAWPGPRRFRSALGRAIGAIPGWIAVFDAQYSETSKSINRVVGRSSPATITTGLTFANGKPAIEVSPGSNLGIPLNLAAYVDEVVDRTNFTFFAVVQRTAALAQPAILWRPFEDATAGQKGFAPTINTANNFAVYNRSAGATTLLLEGAIVSLNVPTLLLMSYSAERGLTIRQNAVQRGNLPAETAPTIPANIVQMGNMLQGNTAGNIRYGLVGLLKGDLTRTSQAARLAQLESGLLSMYSA
ncbi:hypothetical protein [Ancylobacter oerskovii]|uniref:Uncharacterized protein n=1 Tax=Ancylobacter oerskovii TaxID=459519 RepID=A0ABW4YR87_9HYPH|nr:hypothetical protein [Ancylobacter oerskovii]MBS7545695.1 hypothetical protein [Ancylobacter oerskovii]